MAKLHQLLAIESGARNQCAKDITAAHHGLQHAAMLQGIFREYQPLKEDGDKLPPEQTLLQTRVYDVIKDTKAIFQKNWDIVATRDFANKKACADIVVNDIVFAKDVPVPFLLWLEGRLDDIHTFVSKLPTLPADTEWEWDKNQNCYKNKNEIRTHRTVKIPYALQLSPATDKHPAQVVEKAEDRIVGHWITHKYSGAIPVQEMREMKARVEELQKAVKFAREKANQIEVEDQKFSETILKYIFDNVKK